MLDKRYDPKQVENGKYETWKQKGYFRSGDKTKTPFTIVIPPPNVTGKLHIGHACDTTIQDIIIRYKKMQGFDTLYLPGMDHAGIATQAKVMQKLHNSGVDVTKITRDEFLKAAWSWKEEYADNIHRQWAALGLSLDYSKERFTLDEGLNYAVRKVFVSLYEQGLIYQGERIINWDPVQKTALSNVEVIHQDDKGAMYYFKYPICDSEENLIVATTRPETMFGDVCVVVNPNDKRYQKYIGKYCINPANGDKLPIIGDEYVDIEFGTGAMKCTPAHDPNDFIIGKKYGFDMPVIFNKDATMNEKCGQYQGMDRFVCREALIENIKKDGNFIKIEEIVHPVGHSERSNAVVEPMLSKQWFVKMKPLAEQALAQQKTKDKVHFVPDRFEKVFTQWMENIEDWCISRQLWWGHRIPAYYNKKTGEVRVSIDAPKDIENWEQESDVLDTWFSSQLWPFSTLGWPDENSEDLKRYFPTDCLVTGYDIIFFWVSRMITQSLQMTKQIPFKECVIHGLVRDSQGRKMSKTLGNGVDPFDVIDQYGCDALRYFLTTNTTPGLDMRYIDEKVQASSNYLNKIWNSARYVISVLPEDFKETELPESLSPINQWIVNQMEETIKNVTKNMDKYDFNAASGHLYNFVYDDFCSQYLEMCKISLNGEDKQEVSATQQVLFRCLKNIILLISPYTPFIAEEIYLNLPTHKDSVMLESYPLYEKKLVNKTNDKFVKLLMDMVRDVRNYKITNKLAPNKELQIKVHLKEKVFEGFEIILNRFSFSKVIFSKEDIIHEKGEATIYDDGELLIINNDAGEMLERLNKELANEISEVERCEKMLNNPNFISKAPQEKIEVEKAKLLTHQNNVKSLKEKIEKLS